MRRRALAGAVAFALLVVIVLVAGPVRAQTIEVRVDAASATAEPGTNVALGSTSVPPDLRGRSCRASVTVTNGSSTHTGNRLVVASGSSTLVVDGIEETAGAVTTSGGTLTLGPSIDVSVVLGPSGGTSLGLVATCEPIAEPTTTTTTKPPNTTTSTNRPTTTSKKSKEHIPAECRPNPVEQGAQLTIFGGRTDGFGFRGGSDLEVLDGVDGDVLATGVVEANGLFEVSFAVELEPGDYTFEVDSLGAKARAECTVEAGTSTSTVPPSITVDPAVGPVCSSVTVTGVGYVQGDRVSVEIGHAPLGDEVLVDDSGEFTLSALVPDTGPGPFPITATRGAEPEAAPATFEVTEGGPTITVEPSNGAPGGPVEISGSGFAPGDDLDITLGGAPFPGLVDVGTDGTFSVAVEVPELEDGTYPIVVSGGCAAASTAEFTVGPAEPTPTIAVDPSSGSSGDEATVTGEDYRSGDKVDITFGGVDFARGVAVDADGRFEITDRVPEIEPGEIRVLAARGRIPEAADAPFTVVSRPDTPIPPPDECWKILGICWWWWLLILLLVLLLLWFLLWLWCRRRYPFHPGEEIPASGWITCEGDCDCRYRQGRCVSDGAGCPDGCSCELFRRKVWRSGGRWERVSERRERFTWCYRCACARPIEAAYKVEVEAAAEATEPATEES